MYFTYRVRKSVKNALRDLISGADEDLFDVSDMLLEKEDEQVVGFPLMDTYVFHGNNKNTLVVTKHPRANQNHDESAYASFLRDAFLHSSPEYIKEAHAIAQSLIEEHTLIRLQVKVIESERAQVPKRSRNNQDDYVRLVSAVLVSPSASVKQSSKDTSHRTIDIDMYDLNYLCDDKLDILHLSKTLAYVSTKKTLVVLALNDKGTNMPLRGIRVTYLTRPNRPHARIMGAFACSKGVGTLIQSYTEDVIRTHFAYLFETHHKQQMDESDAVGSRVAAKRKEVEFDLYAVPTAVGFWKHVGFTEHDQRKGKTVLMSKRIKVEDRGSSATSATKRAKWSHKS